MQAWESVQAGFRVSNTHRALKPTEVAVLNDLLYLQRFSISGWYFHCKLLAMEFYAENTGINLPFFRAEFCRINPVLVACG
jgi:hypothetical protein